MIGTVMVAVDDSRAAFRAADVAVELADRLGARLVAVSVVDGLLAGEPTPGRQGLARERAALVQARQEDVRAAQRHVAGVAARTGLEVELRVAHGHVAETLLDQARTIGADLVVIGRVERAGVRLTHAVHTAEQVLEFSEVPVLVVPASGH